MLYDRGFSLNKTLLKAIVQYIFETNKEDLLKKNILTEFKKHLSPPTQTTIMTIAEAFIAEGLEEGARKGLSNQLCRLLERCFKPAVPAGYLHQIEEADREMLGHWTENLLEATTLEKVFLVSNCAH